jgi:hypothetical protein
MVSGRQRVVGAPDELSDLEFQFNVKRVEDEAQVNATTGVVSGRNVQKLQHC